MGFWQKWQERVGYGDAEMRYAADELIVLSNMHDGAFTTQIREIENAHRIFVGAATKLSEFRTALGEHCTSRDSDGTVVSLNPPASAFPLLTKLDSLGASFEKLLPDAVAASMKTAAELGPRLKKFYGLKKFGTLDYSRLSKPKGSGLH